MTPTPAEQLAAMLVPMRGELSLEPLCWIDGDSACGVYCYDCAKKEVASNGDRDLTINCDSTSEEDGQRWCDTCGCLLEHSLTDYGVTEELAHFVEQPPETPEDAHVLLTVLGYWGNPMLGDQCGDWWYRREDRPAIRKIIKALKARKKATT